MNVLKDRLDAEIRRRGLAEVEAAALLGVRQTTVNRWRNGTQIPPPKQAAILAEFLNVPRTQVLEWLADAERASRARWVSRSDLDAQLAELRAEVAELRRQVEDHRQTAPRPRENTSHSSGDPPGLLAAPLARPAM